MLGTGNGFTDVTYLPGEGGYIPQKLDSKYCETLTSSGT